MKKFMMRSRVGDVGRTAPTIGTPRRFAHRDFPAGERLRSRVAHRPDARMPRNHLLGLDGLRALAVLGVLWHHAGPVTGAQAVHANGFLGVDLFFVLSGLLITGLLLDEQAANGRIALAKFYVRRSLRIFPLYYAVLAALTLYFVLSSGASSQRETFLRELPWQLSYLSNWVPIHSMLAISWSLSTEEQFYLVWPPLLAWLGRWSLWPLGVFLALNQLLNFGVLGALWPALGAAQAQLNILQITFTPILLGVLLAFALRSPLRERLTRVTAGPMLAVWTLLLAALACWPGDVQGAPRLAFHVVATLMLGGIVLHPGSRIVRALEWRPLAFVGTVSYGVYLLHVVVLDATQRVLARLHIDTAGVTAFVVCALGTIALAALSYRVFERPLLRLKDRWQPGV
jgi:peptidoglycan/LPS O-acetylase OafA/YrhL